MAGVCQICARTELLLKSLRKPLEPKSSVLRGKRSVFLQNFSILILILLNINSASDLHQPGSSVSQVPKSEMSLAWSSRDIEKVGFYLCLQLLFPRLEQDTAGSLVGAGSAAGAPLPRDIWTRSPPGLPQGLCSGFPTVSRVLLGKPIGVGCSLCLIWLSGITPSLVPGQYSRAGTDSLGNWGFSRWSCS